LKGYHDERPAEEVGEEVLGGEGDGDPGDAGAGKERGDVDLQGAENEEEGDEPDDVLHGDLEDVDDPVVHLALGPRRHPAAVEMDEIVRETRYDPCPEDDVERREIFRVEDGGVAVGDEPGIDDGEVDRYHEHGDDEGLSYRRDEDVVDLRFGGRRPLQQMVIEPVEDD